MRLQIWVTAKFINFNETAVIHGNALFSAAVVSRGIRHGTGLHFTLPEKTNLHPKT